MAKKKKRIYKPIPPPSRSFRVQPPPALPPGAEAALAQNPPIVSSGFHLPPMPSDVPTGGTVEEYVHPRPTDFERFRAPPGQSVFRMSPAEILELIQNGYVAPRQPMAPQPAAPAPQPAATALTPSAGVQRVPVEMAMLMGQPEQAQGVLDDLGLMRKFPWQGPPPLGSEAGPKLEDVGPRQTPEAATEEPGFFGRIGAALMGRPVGDIDQRRRALEGMRDIAEGLGNIYVPTPGELMVGAPAPAPFVAEGIRDQLGRLEQEIPEGTRQFYQQRLGIDIPQGMNRRDFETYMRTMAVSPYRAESLALSRDRLEFQKERDQRIAGDFKAAEERRNRSLELAERKWETVPDVDRRELARTDGILIGVDELKTKWAAVKDNLGPIGGRWQKFARYIGMADPGTIATLADLAFQVSQFIYTMTGKQMNEQEMKRLESVLPQAWDDPETFIAVLDSFKDILARDHDARVRGLQGVGKTIGLPGERREGKESRVIGGRKVSGTQEQLNQYEEYLRARSGP